MIIKWGNEGPWLFKIYCKLPTAIYDETQLHMCRMQNGTKISKCRYVSGYNFTNLLTYIVKYNM